MKCRFAPAVHELVPWHTAGGCPTGGFFCRQSMSLAAVNPRVAWPWRAVSRAREGIGSGVMTLYNINVHVVWRACVLPCMPRMIKAAGKGRATYIKDT